MALFERWLAHISFGMSDKSIASVEFYSPALQAASYSNALTQELKDETPLGVFFLAIEALTGGVLKEKGVRVETIDDAVSYPDPNADVYAFDKLGIRVRSGPFNYNWSIPARDGSKYQVSPNGIDVITEGAGASTEITDFIDRLEAIALTKYGQLAVVRGIYVKE